MPSAFMGLFKPNQHISTQSDVPQWFSLIFGAVRFDDQKR